MDVEFGADEEADGCRETGVGLQHLGRLLLNHERTENKDVSKTESRHDQKELYLLTRESRSTASPSLSSGRMFIVISELGMFKAS